MSNIVNIATSLDGYIADKNNGIEWLVDFPNKENTDYGFSDFMKKIDCVLMGRNSYEAVLTLDAWLYEKPVFVLSTKLKTLSEKTEGKAFLVSGKPEDIMAKLSTGGYKNVYIDGGKTIRSFLEKNMIDEMYLSRVPIILGRGIPLFSEMDISVFFRHIKTEIYENGIIKSHYLKA